MRRHRRRLSVFASIAATIILAAPVAAASKEGFKETGVTATVTQQVCAADGTSCDTTFLYAFVGKSKDLGEVFYGGPYRQKVYYEQTHETFDSAGTSVGYSGVFGAVIDSGTVTANGLRSVTVAPTTIQLKAFICDAVTCTTTPAGTVVVEGRWTGVGPTTKHKDKSRVRDGSCVEVNRDQGSSRAAEFSGVAAGNPIEPTAADISEGTILFKLKCA